MQYFSIPYQVFHNGTLICEDVKAIQVMPAALSSGVQTLIMNVKRVFTEKTRGKRVDVFVSPGAIEQVNKEYYDTLSLDERATVAFNFAMPPGRYQQLSRGL